MGGRSIKRADGFALPTAMFFVLGLLAILSIGAVAAVNAQRGAVRDSNSKAALALAESGAEAALLRYGKSLADLTDATPCLGPDQALVARLVPLVVHPDGTRSGGWCPPISSTEDSGDSYTYWVRPYRDLDDQRFDIVAQAAVDDVHRRILLDAGSVPGQGGGFGVVGAENVVGIEWLDMSNNAQVAGGAGSNGWVKMVGSAGVCGSLRSGTNSFTINNGSAYPKPGCANAKSTEVKDYPDPEPPADIEEHNSNARAFVQDGAATPNWYKQQAASFWNPAARSLTLANAGPDVVYDMTGTEPYLLCKLTVNGPTLRMSAPGTSVRIFFLRPDQCGGLSGPQLQIANGSKVVAADPDHVPGFFLLGGSGSRVDLQGGGSTISDVVIYGPNSTVDLANGFRFRGAIIGKTVTLAGGGQLDSSFDGESYELPIPGPGTPGGLARDQFVECVAEPQPLVSTEPDLGC